MTGRSRIGKFYAERDRYGRFKKFVSIKRSSAHDRGNRARTIVKSGYGNRGDLKEALNLDGVYRF